MALLGWQNAVEAAGVGLTASSAAAGYGPEALRVPIGNPSVAWMTALGVTSASLVIAAPGAIDWRAVCLARTNLTPAATMRVRVGSPLAPDYDSGVVPAGVRVGVGQALHLLPAVVPGATLTIDINDAGNPDSRLNIPLVYAGPGAEIAIAPQSDTGIDVRRGDVITRGGTVLTQALSAARSWQISVGFARDAALGWLDELEAAAAAGRNVLFVPRLAHPRAAGEAIFGLLAPGRRGFLGPSGLYRIWAATITERL
nr:hypothetical protein [uncultured Roseococcus sp.]